MRQLFGLFAAVLLVFATLGWVPAQGDPIDGIWKLNLAKSEFTPEARRPKSQTRTYEASSNGIKLSTEGIDANGNRVSYGFTANYDGKYYPYNGQIGNGSDSVAFKRIDAYTIDFSTKKAGKVLVKGTAVVSKDGKVLTITSKGTNASGQPESSVQIFDKQ